MSTTPRTCDQLGVCQHIACGQCPMVHTAPRRESEAEAFEKWQRGLLEQAEFELRVHQVLGPQAVPKTPARQNPASDYATFLTDTAKQARWTARIVVGAACLVLACVFVVRYF